MSPEQEWLYFKQYIYLPAVWLMWYTVPSRGTFYTVLCTIMFLFEARYYKSSSVCSQIYNTSAAQPILYHMPKTASKPETLSHLSAVILV